MAHKRLPRETEKATEIPTLAANGKGQLGPIIGEVSHTIKVTRKTYGAPDRNQHADKM